MYLEASATITATFSTLISIASPDFPQTSQALSYVTVLKEPLSGYRPPITTNIHKLTSTGYFCSEKNNFTNSVFHKVSGQRRVGCIFLLAASSSQSSYITVFSNSVKPHAAPGNGLSA